MSVNISAGNYNPKRVIVTDDGKKYEKPGFARTMGAVAAAGAAGTAAQYGIQGLSSIPAMTAIKNKASMQSDIFKTAIDAAFEKSGLAQKGVKLVDAVSENSKMIEDALEKNAPKWIKKSPVAEKALKIHLSKVRKMLFDGQNAFFVPRANAILVNKDKMSFAAFHEMGHAMNKHFGAVSKSLQKMRVPFMLLSGAAFLTAMFKRKKADGEQPKGWFDKTTTFIKNNAGKLAALGMLPTIAEEGLASIKAHKLAKGVLPADKLKMINKFNAKAWLTYVGAAAGLGVGAYVVSKVRDAIAKPKEIA